MPTSSRRSDHEVAEGLTGLVNRSGLRRILSAAQEESCGVGVVYLDVDRFHQVNTRWGRTIGDRVLDALALRLASRLPPGAFLTATEGDAYLAVLPGGDPASTRSMAEAMTGAVREAIQTEDVSLSLGASAGFCCQGASEHNQDLIEQAFLACRRAKSDSPGSVIEYDSALGAEAESHQRIEEGLRRAIADDQLRLHTQPILDLRDGRMVGVEALLRWQHPEFGLLAPAEFLAVAEVAGLMVEIGGWVIDRAFELAARWRAARPDSPMRVWVNLATQQLADGDRLCARVRDAIAQGDIDPADIGFEVTESSLLEDLPGAVEVLRTLREMGVQLALDDFGTGYSSLSYLRRLPVTAVKIDRMFVGGIGDSLADEAIVEAVIDLAHALGLRVVAEGIEEESQAQALIRMGADEVQGYHFGYPVPPELVEPFFDTSWCSAPAPPVHPAAAIDHRADHLPGFGSPRARLLLAALDSAHDSTIVTAARSVASVDSDRTISPIVYVNAAFEAETGYRSRDVVGRTTEMLLADRSSESITAYEQLGAGGQSATAELANRRADGTTFLCEVTVSPIFDERGVHTHWLHVRRDLTQRRAAEGDRARFQSLIEQSSSLVMLTEVHGNWVYANAAQRQALGIALDEPLNGQSPSTHFSNRQLSAMQDVILPAAARDGRWSGPTSFKNRITGEVTQCETEVQLVEDPLRPGVVLSTCISRDVTELNALAAAERRRRELGEFAGTLARRALDQVGDAVFADAVEALGSLGRLLQADFAYLDAIDLDAGVLSPLGHWTSSSHYVEHTISKPIDLTCLPLWVERLKGAGLTLEHLSPETPNPWTAEIEAVFGPHPAGPFIYAPLRVNGQLVGVLGLSKYKANLSWSTDEVDTVRQVADTIANVLWRSRIGASLRTNEARLVAMLGNVNEVLTVIDPDGRIRYVNSALQRILGYHPTDVIGRNFLSFVHADDHDLALRNFADTVRGRDDRSLSELRLILANGGSVWFEVDTTGTFDTTLDGFVLSLRDITLQREAAEAATRRQEFERMVLELARWALSSEAQLSAAGLETQLARLGEVLRCDRVTLTSLDGDVLRTIAEWELNPWHGEANEDLEEGCLGQPDGRGRSDSVGQLVEREAPALAKVYRTLDPLVVDDLEGVDSAWADDWRTQQIGCRSGLNVPLRSGDRCLGDIGVSMRTNPRCWTSEEITLLQRVSETMSALLERQRLELSLTTSEARMRALLNGSRDLVAVIDEVGTMTYANVAVQRRLGYRIEDLVGQNIAIVVHPDDLEHALTRMDGLFSGNGKVLTTVRLVAADGTSSWWEIGSGSRADPVAGGAVLVCREVTSRLRLEERNASREAHLRYAFRLAQSALDLDAAAFLAQLDQVCSSVAEILGVDVVFVDQVDEGRKLLINRGIHGAGTPEPDAERWQVGVECVRNWLEALRPSQPLVVADLADHDAPWIAERRQMFGREAAVIAVGMSAAGELVGILGVSMADTTRVWTGDEVTFLHILAETMALVFERVRVDEALRSSEAHFRLLSETAADVVMLVDDRLIVRYASPSSFELLGYTPDQLVGRNVESFVSPELVYSIAEDVRKRGSSFTNELQFVRGDGKQIWVASATSVVFDPQSGRPVEYRTSVRDISDVKRLEAELERQALHDPLTGLANRILLQRRLVDATRIAGEASDAEADLDHATGMAADLAVLLLDLDGFKAVNDTYGHAVGDEVLRVVASRLSVLSRPSDTFARTGGDEFVLLCPATDCSTALEIGKRISSAFDQEIVVGGISVMLRASIGVAHQRGPGARPDSLLLDADGAMYAAKHRGGARVAVADVDSRAFGRSVSTSPRP